MARKTKAMEWCDIKDKLLGITVWYKGWIPSKKWFKKKKHRTSLLNSKHPENVEEYNSQTLPITF